MNMIETNTNSQPQGIPAILSGHALKSLRDSGYSLAAALGEVVDNSIEADANNICLHLQESQANSRKKHIHQIVIVDDGCGMNAETLQYYPQLGFSTRYMSTKTIGKYGVGAKLAALNYGRRIDVWSRRQNNEPWQHIYFDLDEALEEEENGREVRIAAPTNETVPKELTSFLPPDSGTIVVWSKVDRLEDGRRAPDPEKLRHEVEKELSRMFRNFLNGGIRIIVNETKLLPHDPIFLMKGTWADQILLKHYLQLSKTKDGKQSSIVSEAIKKTHFSAQRIGKDEIKIGEFTATLTVTLYPKEVVRERFKGGDELAQKLRVPENEGCISFVRLDREINYTPVPRIFPRGVENADRFIGIEVTFTPELDEHFGVRNVKRGVEPYDDLRKEIRLLLKKRISEARSILEEIWGTFSRDNQEHQGEHMTITKEVKKVNRTLPKSRVKILPDEKEKELIYEDLAKDVVGEDKKAQEEYKENIKELPFVLETMDVPGDMFIETQYVDSQVIIRLNKRHRFYREMWEPIRSIANSKPGSISSEEASHAARRTIEALTLLLIAYAKAESMDENPRERYGELRSYWGMFTDRLMGKVKDVI